jgi:nucleoside-diphosphate-sugar epimerase
VLFRSHQNKNIDIKFSNLCQNVINNNYILNKLSTQEQLQSKFIISIEGNDVATNLKWILYSNSVVIMPKPTICSWIMEDKLISGTHYIEIKSDYSDLEEKYKWCLNNLEECKKINEKTPVTFNFISSWFVYGETNLPAKEEYFCSPIGFYSITKKAAEDLLISFCKTYGVKYRIIRLCNVLGKGDKSSSSKKNALSYMIELLKKNEDVYLYDNGKQSRDVMHIKDVCTAIKLISDKGTINEIYNVGSGHPTETSAIIELAKKYLNSSSQIKFKDITEFTNIVQVKNFWMNTAKLNRLGFKQTIPLEETIRELCIN